MKEIAQRQQQGKDRHHRGIIETPHHPQLLQPQQHHQPANGGNADKVPQAAKGGKAGQDHRKGDQEEGNADGRCRQVYLQGAAPESLLHHIGIYLQLYGQQGVLQRGQEYLYGLQQGVLQPADHKIGAVE
ncbi:hypothetical protein ADICEAN_04215 [Cesiribacter andamanensis AMV16]|uniref:Uncharacterized protein n=1 Tax=Cesiribacter andamanensis AMV16 TaxID=1279009 RepID=M7MW47_9BACT|nr:hypothetical protein ADICEAN_04215 [Cesiribacter andamanensis AMV16]